MRFPCSAVHGTLLLGYIINWVNAQINRLEWPWGVYSWCRYFDSLVSQIRGVFTHIVQCLDS